MGGTIPWTISLAMIALFSIAIIGFAINFGADNSAAVQIINDPQIVSVYNTSTGNMSDFRGQSENTYTSILNSTITTGGQTTTSGGQFALTPFSLLGVVKNIFLVGFTKIFGSGSGFSIFLTTFFGLLVIITVLYVWKTWAGRGPD